MTHMGNLGGINITWLRGFVTLLPMGMLLIADVLADPHSASLTRLSGLAHLTAMVFAIIVIASHAWDYRRVVLLVAFAFLLKTFDGHTEARFLYVVALCLIFAAAGYCMANFSRNTAERLILVLLALCALAAGLQIVGAYDSVYLWTRHGYGYLPNGESFPIAPVISIFQDVEELGAINTLQMRPSAIFAANQTFAGFTLFSTAVALMYRGHLAWVFACLLGVCIALSGAKVLVVGVPLICALAYFFVPQSRRQVFRILVSLSVCVFLYAILFPGIFSYNMNLRLVLSSVVVRLLDLVNAGIHLAGLEEHFGDIDSIVLSALDRYFGASPFLLRAFGDGWEGRDYMRSAYYGGGSLSLFAEAARHPLHTAVVVILVSLIAWTHGRIRPSQQIRRDSVFAVALLFFGMVASTAASPLYWYWVGWGGYLVFGRAFRQRSQVEVIQTPR